MRPPEPPRRPAPEAPPKPKANRSSGNTGPAVSDSAGSGSTAQEPVSTVPGSLEPSASETPVPKTPAPKNTGRKPSVLEPASPRRFRGRKQTTKIADSGASGTDNPRAEAARSKSSVHRGSSVPGRLVPSSMDTDASATGRVLPSTQVEQRRKEKRWAGLRLRFRGLLKWLIGVTAVGALVWLLGFSTVFSVKEESIQVATQSGARAVDEETAVRRLSEEIGTPLLRVNTGRITADLEEDSQIAEAHVTRLWPNGLGAELVPRVAVVAVEAADGYKLIAEDGVVVRVAEKIPSKLPLVEVGSGNTDPTQTQIDQITDMRQSVPKKIRKRIEKITLRGTVLSFELKDGVTVVWGDSSDAELKAEVLQLLMAERKAQIYDVSTPGRPSTR